MLLLLLLASSIVVTEALGAAVAASIRAVTMALAARATSAIGTVSALVGVQTMASLLVTGIAAIATSALLASLHRRKSRCARGVGSGARTSSARERRARSSSGLGVNAVRLQVIRTGGSTRRLSVRRVEAMARLRVAGSTAKSIVTATKAAASTKASLTTGLAGPSTAVVVNARTEATITSAGR